MTIPSASEPIVLDSSGWLEYLTEDTKADLFAPYLEGEKLILVPAIVVYEVRKVLLQRQPKVLADVFVSEALRRTIIAIDEMIALAAATITFQHGLAMADALIYATAQTHTAQLITSVSHFQGLPGVTLL